MRHRGIHQFSKFLFLNSYAFLLLILGIGIGVIPFYKLNWWLVLVQVFFVGIFLISAVRIFSSWEHKKRDYSILIRKNEKDIRPSSFLDYMQAPCGRLLTILVLYDLGQVSRYKELKKLQSPLKNRLREGCIHQKTVITVYKRIE
jgi:hypothetical protein